jgi:hypothetical protein
MNREFQSKPFIISNKELEKTTEWFEHDKALSSAHLYYDDKTDILEKQEQGVKIILVGYILDIKGRMPTEDAILSALCDLYLREDDLAFYEQLNYLNGRYVLMIDDGADTRVFTDATCLRPVFYWENEIMGSHESLVREIVEQEHDIALGRRKYRMNGFLDFTTTDGIYKMNPNLYYSSKVGAFTRYYPRATAKSLELDEVVENTMDMFSPQVEWLNRNYKTIYQSLTGGYDSKVSLAIMKPLKDKIKYFTYMIDLENTPDSQFSRIYKKDKDLVDRLVYNLNLDHEYYFFPDYDMPKDYEIMLNRNVSSYHSYVLSYLTYKEFEKEGIHVKSTIYEMAKMPFATKYDYATEEEDILSAMLNWAPKSLRGDRELLREMYHSFIERTHFDQVKSLGYNIPMMIYWEARMGNWHGNITQETDNTVETFIFVNNRYMLDQFISLEREAREARSYFDRLISECWPILNYFVPNRYETLEDVAKRKIQTASTASNARVKLKYRGYGLVEMKNVEVAAEEENIELQPLAGVKLKDDEISFTIVNEGTASKTLHLQGYYRHSSQNIFVQLGDKNYSINDFYEGMPFELYSGEKVKIIYHYSKNFDRASWYKAGHLTIKEV